MHYFYEVGALNLTAGYGRMHVACGRGDIVSAQVYIFWHVWIWDGSTRSTVSASNSGYLWYAPALGCPSTGGARTVISPALVKTFNTSSYSRGGTWYVFNASHSYTFELFIGCTGSASVSAAVSGTAVSDCNTPRSSANTFTINRLVIV